MFTCTDRRLSACIGGFYSSANLRYTRIFGEKMTTGITVIGGGLAGAEAAWQIARAGLQVRLFEMRPVVSTEAHKTGRLGELVCSNSLKSDLPATAPFLLKEELRRLGSLMLRVANEVKVPAG